MRSPKTSTSSAVPSATSGCRYANAMLAPVAYPIPPDVTRETTPPSRNTGSLPSVDAWGSARPVALLESHRVDRPVPARRSVDPADALEQRRPQPGPELGRRVQPPPE